MSFAAKMPNGFFEHEKYLLLWHIHCPDPTEEQLCKGCPTLLSIKCWLCDCSKWRDKTTTRFWQDYEATPSYAQPRNIQILKKWTPSWSSKTNMFGNIGPSYVWITKALTKYEGSKMKRDARQKWCLFYSWQLRKRHHFWRASLFIFGPSYFVKALVIHT